MLLSFFDFLSELVKQGTTFSQVLAIIGLLAVLIIGTKIIPVQNRVFFIIVFILLAFFGIVWEIFFNNSKLNKNVTPDELVGMYKGRIQPLNLIKSNINPAFFTGDGFCRIDIKTNLDCTLYSEKDTIEQALGGISSLRNPVSTILIPKIGWAVCEKRSNLIILRNDSLKNNNYYFNFTKFIKNESE